MIHYTHICATYTKNVDVRIFQVVSTHISPSIKLIIFLIADALTNLAFTFFLLLQFPLFVLLILTTEVPYVRAMHAATDQH